MEISKRAKECTCCGDVIKLLECTSKPPKSFRDFVLYKTSIYGDKKTAWCYYLLIKDDSFPIVITEDVANKILNEPEYGAFIATSHWFNRWR